MRADSQSLVLRIGVSVVPPSVARSLARAAPSSNSVCTRHNKRRRRRRREKKLFLTACPIWISLKQRTHKIFKLCALFISLISMENSPAPHRSPSHSLRSIARFFFSLHLFFFYHCLHPYNRIQARQVKFKRTT